VTVPTGVLEQCKATHPRPSHSPSPVSAHDAWTCSGFRVQGSGLRAQGLRFRAQGSRLRTQGSGFRIRVQGLGLRS
jgi:hypothetical protein